ncbi:MAG: HK97 gp10 family phage protein [Clostridia bacterium]|nr:HK97 gp10 family phage protein [Clostridia bacterium]
MPGAGMKFKVQVKGLDTLHRNLRKLAQQYPDEVFAELYAEAEEIMTESKEECPVDTGTLRDSGFVEPDKSRYRVRVGYGGPATKINPKTGQMSDEYAVIVHEDLNAHHKAGKKAKFLEDPANRRLKGMAGRIARAVKARLGI